jgi:hypothetical protein
MNAGQRRAGGRGDPARCVRPIHRADRHRRRRSELGPWDAAKARAGLHPAALDLIADRKVAVLGSDSNSDSAPSVAEGVELPVHVLVNPIAVV